MYMQELEHTLHTLWSQLYPGMDRQLLNDFIADLNASQKRCDSAALEPGWYQSAVVYAVYVDHYNKGFHGLEAKLDELQGLGINCLWLLPILESPMHDGGFDIRDYYHIRAKLVRNTKSSSSPDPNAVFVRFLEAAHKKNIRIIFDVALNHTSDQHEWFNQAVKFPGSPYRDYYMWSQHDRDYPQARIIFKGLVSSNWEASPTGYYFHRFYAFQPDLNYRNPAVLIAMSQVLVFWLEQGVDGFRADAIPYLWKEKGTNCENLPQTFLIVQFFRAVMDLIRPNSLLLAEACQKPQEIVRYLAAGQGCNAVYHFPLMPMLFKAIASGSSAPIKTVLNSAVSPPIPDNCQWFTFLRCHDELSLEEVYVNEADRDYLHRHYCLYPHWDFREGEGVSARLSELMKGDARKILLAYCLVVSLPGTPVIYYGDEFALPNNESFFQQQVLCSHKKDSRNLVRGPLDWDWIEQELSRPKSLSYQVLTGLKQMLNLRREMEVFARGELKWISLQSPSGNLLDQLIAFSRQKSNRKLLVICNLSDQAVQIRWPIAGYTGAKEVLGGHLRTESQTALLPAFGYFWLTINPETS